MSEFPKTVTRVKTSLGQILSPKMCTQKDSSLCEQGLGGMVVGKAQLETSTFIYAGHQLSSVLPSKYQY